MAIATTVDIDLRRLAGGVSLAAAQVEAVVALLDDGNTVPFITRYRKDQTGGLDEVQIRQIQSELARLRLLAERKQTILRSIDSQGKLTDELARQIESADNVKRLEDLYLPFKPRKQTLATTARQRGLGPLADEVLAAAAVCHDLDARAADFVDPDRQVPTIADVLLGVGHILAEGFSERADLRGRLRKVFRTTGKLVCTRVEKAKPSEKDEKRAKQFRDYYDFNEKLGRLPPHRILAINRGERGKVLRAKIDADVAEMEKVAGEMLVPDGHPHQVFLRECARDSLARLIVPGLEREARRELTDKAETHAVEVFARNLRRLLLQPPVRSRRLLAVDPGLRSGCKLAALDEFGGLLDHAVVHLVGKAERIEQAKEKVVEMIRGHRLSVVAVGNGTGSREAELLLAELIADKLKDDGVKYVIVNEAGASVYSTSPLGREELPDYDATLRGAISIGRRLQDPLSELVKIDPASIGVGLYQHDVKAKHLRDSLDAVVESCVNFVAVDLNSASPALLRYVSGLNQLTARRVYEHRVRHGPFRSRQQLKEVSGFGEAAFVQAAGFLKIADGADPLDATWIHPESYDTATAVLESIGATPDDLKTAASPAAAEDSPAGPSLAERLAGVDASQLAARMETGEMLVRDILTQFTRPGRDPREDLPKPMFKSGVLKLEDLSPGMELTGSVLNVVDFGVFVDIGLHDTGLVHVSQLANQFVKDPHEVAAVGDVVTVWVREIDKDRRRVALTMVRPGTQRPPPQRTERKESEQQKDRPPRRTEGRGGRPGGGKPGGGRPGGGKPKFKPPRPKAKPKFVAPITEAMVQGQEPMRTFSDLAQFFNKKSETDGKKDDPA